MSQSTVQSSSASSIEQHDYEEFEVWHPRFNPWIIAFTVTLATFMEALDTSIANVALPHIAGSLASSQDENYIIKN